MITELLIRQMRGEQRGKNGDQQHQQNIDQADQRAFVAPEVVPEFAQRGKRLRRAGHGSICRLRHCALLLFFMTDPRVNDAVE